MIRWSKGDITPVSERWAGWWPPEMIHWHTLIFRLFPLKIFVWSMDEGGWRSLLLKETALNSDREFKCLMLYSVCFFGGGGCKKKKVHGKKTGILIIAQHVFFIRCCVLWGYICLNECHWVSRSRRVSSPRDTGCTVIRKWNRTECAVLIWLKNTTGRGGGYTSTHT